GASYVMLLGNLGTLKLMIDPEPDMHPNRWYWYPTRILGESTNGAGGAITEMPFFSFLYGDLHAHIIGLLPVTVFLMIGWMLVQRRSAFFAFWLGVLAGIMYMTNTWDVLLYVPLGGLLLILASVSMSASIRHFIRLSIFTAIGGILTITPYYLHFTLGENGGFEKWQGAKSLLEPFLMTWGIPMSIIGFWLVHRLKRLLVPEADSPVEIGMLILVFVAMLILPSTTATTVLLAIFILAGIVLARFDDVSLRYVHLATALIFLILLLPEFIVVKGDVGRQNTVFKSAFQVWVWLGLLIPVLLYEMFVRGRMYLQVAVCAVLLLLGFLYPIRALPAREADSETGSLTLNGYQFMDSMVLFYDDDPIVTRRDRDLT
ncbi:MAG TPA: DUF2298 domain-containing protein, partial [Aggregatilineales bacterium]|nr:DUF2298 domain-containing protein [Aggregatilineales bacterium]